MRFVKRKSFVNSIGIEHRVFLMYDRSIIDKLEKDGDIEGIKRYVYKCLRNFDLIKRMIEANEKDATINKAFALCGWWDQTEKREFCRSRMEECWTNILIKSLNNIFDKNYKIYSSVHYAKFSTFFDLSLIASIVYFFRDACRARDIEKENSFWNFFLDESYEVQDDTDIELVKQHQVDFLLMLS